MRCKISGKDASERGEVMLEASIILLSIMTLLMALLSISFMFYQQSLMNTIATEIASEVAKDYKFTEIEVGNSDYSLTNTYGVNAGGSAYTKDERKTKIYGMSFGKESVESAHASQAELYAKERLEKASLGLNPGRALVEEIIPGIKRTRQKFVLPSYPACVFHLKPPPPQC